MPLDATFSVEGSSAVQEHTVAYGATVDLAVLSTEFTSIDWEIVSSSKSGATAPTITRAGTPNGATASFPQVADPGDGLGRAWVVKCTVRDARGQTDTEYRVVGSVNANGLLPICADEYNYRHATHGWSQAINALMATPGITIPYDVTVYGASTGGSAASNVTAITAAVAAVAAAGGSAAVYWPTGTYNTDASIPLLHTVRHVGPGAIQRGSDVFYLEPKPSQQNTIYGAPSGGSTTNDGLSASQPISTVQICLDVFAAYARDTAADRWRIKFAAGTFTEGGVLDGVRSAAELLVEGSLSAGVPDCVIDGTGATKDNGLNFNECNFVYVKNVKCQDWTTTSDSCGIAAQNGTRITIETCHGSGNSFADFNASEFADMNLIGTCVGTSLIGARYYRQSTGSVGDGTNLIDLSGSDAGGSIGIQVRDTSTVVCNDNIDLSDRNYGAYIWKNSYLELRDATISSCTVGVLIDALSLCATSGGTQTMAGNGENWRVRGHSHNQDNSIVESQFDTTNTRWLYGASTAYGALNLKFMWSREGAKSSSQFHASAWIGMDGGTQATNYWSFAGPDNHVSGWIWSDSTGSAKGYAFYDIGGARFRWAPGGTERWSMDATGFFPLNDNARSFGSSSLRLAESYVVARRWSATVFDSFGTGTPEGAVTAGIGSTFRRTDGGAGTSFYVKESGAGNTGWVAK